MKKPQFPLMETAALSFRMMGDSGLEPLTSCVSSKYSNQLSWSPIVWRFGTGFLNTAGSASDNRNGGANASEFVEMVGLNRLNCELSDGISKYKEPAAYAE